MVLRQNQQQKRAPHIRKQRSTYSVGQNKPFTRGEILVDFLLGSNPTFPQIFLCFLSNDVPAQKNKIYIPGLALDPMNLNFLDFLRSCMHGIILVNISTRALGSTNLNARHFYFISRKKNMRVCSFWGNLDKFEFIGSTANPGIYILFFCAGTSLDKNHSNIWGTVGLDPSGNSAKIAPVVNGLFCPTEYVDLCFRIWGARFCRLFCLKTTPFYQKIQPKVP